MSNQSKLNEFVLHGFSEMKEMQTFHFVAFLIIYLVALMENLLIITIILYNLQHKPMYFFMAHLAFQDLGSISVTVPKSMINSFMNIRSISYTGCVCQVFFLVSFTTSHFYILGVMAYDRYVAICNPLHYEMVMNRETCVKMATGSWSAGLVYATVLSGTTFTIDFCSNEINQFFCEIPQLFKLSCSDSYPIAFWIVSGAGSLSSFYFTLIIYSYVEIFKTVLRIPSTQGKQKAFSTCLPHLIVIIMYFITGTFAYLQPTSKSPLTMNLLISMSYCMLPPVANPVIYSMKNKEIKRTFWKFTSNIFLQFLQDFHCPGHEF